MQVARAALLFTTRLAHQTLGSLSYLSWGLGPGFVSGYPAQSCVITGRCGNINTSDHSSKRPTSYDSSQLSLNTHFELSLFISNSPRVGVLSPIAISANSLSDPGIDFGIIR